MLGRLSSTQVGVFESVAGGVGHSWFSVELTSEHVELEEPFSGFVGDALVGVFEEEVPLGGVGHSWFSVELTSEHVEEDFTGFTDDVLFGVFDAEVATVRATTWPIAIVPVSVEHPSGGVGYSWFTVELTSDPVPVVYDDSASGTIVASGTGEELHEVPRPLGPGRLQPRRQPRRRRLTYRFSARFTVVESIELRARGRYYVDRERRFAGRYEVVASTRQAINASYVVSDIRALLLQEEDELLLLEEF